MLDKSVPYYNILMCREPGTDIPDCPLPEGYSFSFFHDGNEHDWVDIETSVLEFDGDKQRAMDKFHSHFYWAPEETGRRCVFLKDPEGRYIGTATIWWEYSGQRRDPWLSYVAIRPEYQGKGLSKALVSHMLRLSQTIEGDRRVYLHTQTWSHIAVRLYKKFGFYITREPDLYKYRNDEYEQAEKVLSELYDD